MDSSVVKASFWAMMSEIISKLVGPVSFLVLTRILSPADFGVVAVATTIVSFLNIITDLGVSKVLVQEAGSAEQIKRLSDAGFIINIVIGSILFLVMSVGSKGIALMMNAEKSQYVILALSVQIIFYSLSSIQIALRDKALEFKFLFYVRLITSFVPAMISIPFAFLGFSYWSIICGQIAGSMLSAAYLWLSSSWRPSFKFKMLDIKYILSKSVWSSLEQIVLMIPCFLDTYLLSSYLGLAFLGIYTTCRTLFDSAMRLTLGAIRPVIFSYLSKIKNHQDAFIANLIKAQKVISTLAFILGISVFLFSKQIENIFFTNKWTDISVYLAPLFLIMSVEYFSAAISEGIRSIGKFKIISINTIISTVITIPVLFISVRYGLLAYIVLRACCLFLFYPILFNASRRNLHIGFIDCVVNNASIIISLTTIIICYYLVLHIYGEVTILQLILSLILFISVSIFNLRDVLKILTNNPMSILKIKIYIAKLISVIRYFLQAIQCTLFLRVKSKNNLSNCDFLVGKKILILIPHADDELIGCYSILSDPIYDVDLLYFEMTGGFPDMADIRMQELENCAKYFNRRLFLFESFLTQRYSTYDVILTPSFIDWHPEHRMVANFIYDIITESIYSNSILVYNVSVPHAINSINIVSELSKKSSVEKYRQLKVLYPSQSNLPLLRFKIQEIIDAIKLNTNYFGCESYIYFQNKSYIDFIDRQKNNEKKINDYKNYICNIYDIRCIIEKKSHEIHNL